LVFNHLEKISPRLIASEKCSRPSSVRVLILRLLFSGPECNDALLFWCSAQVGVGFLHHRSQIVFGDDVVAVKNRARPMTADRHNVQRVAVVSGDGGSPWPAE